MRTWTGLSHKYMPLSIRACQHSRIGNWWCRRYMETRLVYAACCEARIVAVFDTRRKTGFFQHRLTDKERDGYYMQLQYH